MPMTRIWPFISLLIFFGLGEAANKTYLYSDEQVLEELLLGYDRRVLPTRDGSPVNVEVRANVVDMAEQKTIHSHFGIELVVHSFWNDHRLAFNNSEKEDIRLAANKADLVWTPDLMFEEKIGVASKITTDNKFVAIFGNGDILHSQRVILTMFCPMDFSNFPFDDQDCKVPIISYPYSDDQVILDWMSTSGGKTLPGLVLRKDPKELGGSFFLEDFGYSKDKRNFGTAESFDELLIELRFHRRISYYFVRIYLPLILIVVLSFGAFWIDYRSTPARTIMATTIVLTAVTFIVSIQSSLPPTTSIRSIDIYSLSCFIFVFASLVEFAFVQSVDIRVRMIERAFLKKRKAGQKKSRQGKGKKETGARQPRPHSVGPAETITSEDLPDINVNGFLGKVITRVYRAHLQHREEYHILDHISKRAFPLTFCVLNAIYFIVYTAHV